MELSWCLGWVIWLASGSQLIHHLGSNYFESVYVVSLGYAILLKVLPCPLPSCFTLRPMDLSLQAGEWPENTFLKHHALGRRPCRLALSIVLQLAAKIFPLVPGL